jgi:hypothetical protein
VNRTPQARSRRAWALIGGALLLGGGFASTPAFAGDSASTGASVGGSATAPNIECGWALPDANKDWSGATKMQYLNDDTPLVGAGSPCVATTDGTEEATMPTPYNTRLIDIKPNAHDEPTQAYVELWGAIDTTNASPSVYFDVYHPDGTQKTQIDAAKYASSANPAACAGPPGMFTATQTTGQLTAGAVAAIQAECQTQAKQLYYGAFGISKHQPWGLYKIVLTAAAASGSSSTKTFFIYVMPFSNLEKDFTSVSFGAVTANSHFETNTGNFTFDGVDNASNQAYSVRNTGNAGIGLGIKFASMCLDSLPNNSVSCTDNKRIDHFDGKFGVGTTLNLQSIGNVSLGSSLISDLASEAKPAPYGPVNNFDNDYKRTLCPNDVGKLEFSIWTENIQAGSYSAANGVQLVARTLSEPASLCATDNGSVYPANRGLPASAIVTTPKSTNHWPVV